MATRAKYTRVRQESEKEDKPETDIIMKFSPTYGTCRVIQADMSAEPSLSSSGREKPSSPSRQPIDSWTEPFGSLRSSREEFLVSTKSPRWKRKRSPMCMNPERKDSLESSKRDSSPSSKSPWLKTQLRNRRRLPDIKLPLLVTPMIFWPRRSGNNRRLKERREVRTDPTDKTDLPEKTDPTETTEKPEVVREEEEETDHVSSVCNLCNNIFATYSVLSKCLSWSLINFL